MFELLGSFIVPVLMDNDIWLPIFLGLGLYIPTLICASCLPKFLGVNHLGPVPSQLPPCNDTEDGGCVHDYETISIPSKQPPEQWESPPLCGPKLSKRWSTFLLNLRDDSKLSALFFTFLVTVLSYSAHENLLQFSRNRFGWSWSQVSALGPP